MSVKTCRALQIAAFVLLALAFLGSIAAIPFQKSILSLYTSDPEILNRFNFPWAANLSTFLMLIPALIYLILVFRHMAPGGSKATVIILAIVTGFLMALVIPVLTMLITTLVNKEGMWATVHYNYLNNAVSTATAFLTIPAKILMFLSLGGFFGKDTRA